MAVSRGVLPVCFLFAACDQGAVTLEGDTATDAAVADTDGDPASDTEDPGPVTDTPVGDGLPSPESAATWPDTWASFADRVFALTNDRRSRSANCGSEGTFEAAPALSRDALLDLAARRHTVWMAEAFANTTTKLDHASPGGPFGDTMVARAEAAGYDWRALGENIAWNSVTPEDVVAGWMRSPGHCKNIMNPSFTEIGVAYVQIADGQTWWTQDFGRPK